MSPQPEPPPVDLAEICRRAAPEAAARLVTIIREGGAQAAQASFKLLELAAQADAGAAAAPGTQTVAEPEVRLELLSDPAFDVFNMLHKASRGLPAYEALTVTVVRDDGEVLHYLVDASALPAEIKAQLLREAPSAVTKGVGDAVPWTPAPESIAAERRTESTNPRPAPPRAEEPPPPPAAPVMRCAFCNGAGAHSIACPELHNQLGWTRFSGREW